MEDAESTTKDPVDRVEKVTWRDLQDGSFTAELKKLICFAAPMAAVVITQSMLQIITMVIVGHLGRLSLASASFAISFCNVTGFSFIVCFLFLFSTKIDALISLTSYQNHGNCILSSLYCYFLMLDGIVMCLRYSQRSSLWS